MDATTLSDAEAPVPDAPTQTLPAVAATSLAAGQTPSTAPHPIVPGAGEQRCAECQAPLAPDQRYCLECGERRGERRFSLNQATGSQLRQGDAGTGSPRGSKWSPGTSLLGLVGTLLLAMGVGVLIGHAGTQSSTKANTPAQVITVQGAGAAAASTSGSPATAATTSTSAGGHAGTPPKTPSTTGKAGSSGAAVVKVGSPGKGAGYKNGKFTGEFFGEEEEK